jgi:hypothetical protein
MVPFDPDIDSRRAIFAIVEELHSNQNDQKPFTKAHPAAAGATRAGGRRLRLLAPWSRGTCSALIRFCKPYFSLNGMPFNFVAGDREQIAAGAVVGA